MSFSLDVEHESVLQFIPNEPDYKIILEMILAIMILMAQQIILVVKATINLVQIQAILIKIMLTHIIMVEFTIFQIVSLMLAFQVTVI